MLCEHFSPPDGRRGKTPVEPGVPLVGTRVATQEPPEARLGRAVGTPVRRRGRQRVNQANRVAGDFRLMYAIVKTGGKQYKVAVGDVVEVEKLEGDSGTEVTFPAVLVVDGTDVTADADALAKVSVTGKLVEQTKGPKIRIHKFKNKTGYQKRQGHRQKLTRVEVTGITK
ncbi:hypothetical protein GCM10020366_49000 [Saccharopolyspora gregorii]|uniref:Large ribosomal subunit protein bL21 n=2 Tax=Pseudonocardiaceae TaxID=2070 RepID=A0ABP6RWN1_9PSEU